MTASGWRKRQIVGTPEYDQFEEVISERILIEEEIEVLEALLGIPGVELQPTIKVGLEASLEMAKNKLKDLK